MKLAEARHSRSNRRCDAGLVGDIAANENRIAAELRLGPCGCCGVFAKHPVDVGNNDLGPLLGEPLGCGTTDAAAAARDESHAPLKSRHVVSSDQFISRPSTVSAARCWAHRAGAE